MNELSWWKLRVTVLWIFLGVAATTGLVMVLYEPGSVREMLRGEIQGSDLGSEELHLQLALQSLVPLAMAFTTIALTDHQLNRRVNGALGLITAANALVSLVRQYGDPSAFIVAVILLVSLLLLWHVWKWPTPGRAASDVHEDPSIGR